MDLSHLEKGAEASHLMILSQGQIDIVYDLASGGEVVVGTVVPGDLMGISAMIPPFHLTASGIAKEDGTFIQIEAAGLRQLCEDVPELGYRIMMHEAKATMDRLGETRVQLAGQS